MASHDSDKRRKLDAVALGLLDVPMDVLRPMVERYLKPQARVALYHTCKSILCSCAVSVYLFAPPKHHRGTTYPYEHRAVPGWKYPNAKYLTVMAHETPELDREVFPAVRDISLVIPTTDRGPANHTNVSHGQWVPGASETVRMLTGTLTGITEAALDCPVKWHAVSVVHLDVCDRARASPIFHQNVWDRWRAGHEEETVPLTTLTPERVCLTGIDRIHRWNAVPFAHDATTRSVTIRGVGHGTAYTILHLQVEGAFDEIKSIRIPVAVWIEMYMMMTDSLQHYDDDYAGEYFVPLLAKCEIEHGGMAINPGLTTRMKRFEHHALLLDAVPIDSLRVLYATYLAHDDLSLYEDLEPGGAEACALSETVVEFISGVLLRILDADSSAAGIVDLYRLQAGGPFAPLALTEFREQMDPTIPCHYSEQVWAALAPEALETLEI